MHVKGRIMYFPSGNKGRVINRMLIIQDKGGVNTKLGKLETMYLNEEAGIENNELGNFTQTSGFN